MTKPDFRFIGKPIRRTEDERLVTGKGRFSADFALAKDFSLTERYKLEFRWENFNTFNNTNLALPDSAVDSGTAGKIFDVASPMRNMQFALKLKF